MVSPPACGCSVTVNSTTVSPFCGPGAPDPNGYSLVFDMDVNAIPFGSSISVDFDGSPGNPQSYLVSIPDDIVQFKDDNSIYLIKKSLVERVQQLFKNAIFPLFQYKTDNEFELKVKEPGLVTKGLPNMFVMVQVQIDYIKQILV